MDDGQKKDDVDPARLRRSWVLSGVGLATIVFATLWLANAGYGTEVRREFGQRRSYDMVKPAVQRAMPGVIVTGLGGLVLMIAGARMRSRDRES